MRSRKVRTLAMLVIAGVVAALGSAIAAEGDGDADPVAVTAADQELLDRLVALQDELPELVPTEAALAANDLDPVLLGSFTSARSTLDRLEDDVRQLFVDGDEAKTAVGDAVSMIARGLLVERQGLMVLESSDGSSNPRPLDASNARDDEGTAIDADGLLGLERMGIDLLLQGRTAQREGYEVLVTIEDGDPALAARYDALVAYEETVAVDLRVVAAEDTDELLVPTERYDAPVGVARATSVTYVCVDRDAYLALADLPPAERIAGSIEEVPGPECAAIARRAGLSLTDQQTFEEDGGSAAADAPAEDADTGDGTED